MRISVSNWSTDESDVDRSVEAILRCTAQATTGQSTGATSGADVGAAAADPTVKSAHRAMWALGDYPRIAREVLTDLGPELVRACAVGPGQRVLDVAAGSGLVAIPAAATGASVVAADLTPEMFRAGQQAAAAAGVSLEWVEADAEALPFDDAEFDVVLSCLGVMFAPDHRAAAAELVRVCRPGGTIGLINWAAGGSIDAFFRVFAPYRPAPPPGSVPPIRWGDEGYVRDLLGGRVEGLRAVPGAVRVEHFGAPADFCAYYRAHFGPTIATYAGIAADPDRVVALDRDFLAYAHEYDRGQPGGPAVFEFDYLLLTARKPAGH
jgi:SAM-dependent methyltransferase